MRPQPLIAVTDVVASSRWYQRLLGCRSDHGGKEYERLVHGGILVMQLHRFEVEHHHSPIGDPDDRPYGNGVLLWFEVDDFEAAEARAYELNAEIVMARHRNPPDGKSGPNHWELWLRDPDGYTVVITSPDGSAGRCPVEKVAMASPIGISTARGSLPCHEVYLPPLSRVLEPSAQPHWSTLTPSANRV